MFFHEIEAASFDNERQPPGRHLQSAKIDYFAKASFQIAFQFLVGQEQNVRVVPVSRPFLHMPEPRTEIDPARQEVVEELVERFAVPLVHLVQMVIGDGYVSAITGHINVFARTLRDQPVEQMAFENSWRGAIFKTAGKG